MKRKYYMRGMGIGVLFTAILCAVALPEKETPMTDEQVIARARELGYEKKESGVTADTIDKIKENGQSTGIPSATAAPETSPEAASGVTPEPTLSQIPTPEAPNPPEEPVTPTVKEEQSAGTVTPKPTATKTPTATGAPTKTPTATAAPTKTPTATVEPRPTQTATESPSVTASPEPTGVPAAAYYTITVERGMTARRVAERLVSTGVITEEEEFVQYLIRQNLTDYINVGTFRIPKGAGYAEIAKILTQ